MLPFLPHPTQLMKLSIQSGLILVEAQMVIGMRLLGMMGLWRVTASEPHRMVSEKVVAASESLAAAGRATLRGQAPAAVAAAAMKPIRRRTSANAKRLARRGPGQS